jgi:superfamily I DNA/RNA helicase
MAGAAPRSTTSCASRRIFPGAKVIKLERNYRSTEHILGRRCGPDRPNEGRLGKTLFTDRSDPGGDKVQVRPPGIRRGGSPRHRRGDRAAPARPGRYLNDMAILVRASFQMREFEERFVTLDPNYRVIGGPRFYERSRSATPWPICACPAGRRPRLRAHRQHPEARPRRHHGAEAARYARARDIPMQSGGSRDMIEPTS